MFQDFEQEHMEKHGYGKYEPLPTALLPKLHLVFADNPSDSGKVSVSSLCHCDLNNRQCQSVENEARSSRPGLGTNTLGSTVLQKHAVQCSTAQTYCAVLSVGTALCLCLWCRSIAQCSNVG